MYCSTCGAAISADRRACDTCGAARPVPAVPGGGYHLTASALGIAACPRCSYRGQGLPYFSRGAHVAGLVGATFFTIGLMGAGGAAYYLMRRDHRICPRCGKGWGKHGERAASPVAPLAEPVRDELPAVGRGGGAAGPWAVLAFFFAAVLAVVGVAEGEPVPALLALVAAVGGLALHRVALREREERRAQLLAALQQPVLRLAARRRGVLTVTEVAAELGWPLRRAEKVLQSMDDGYRVSSEVTDEGLLVYEFLELRRVAERIPPNELDPPYA